MTEAWRDVAGHADYRVSDLGNVTGPKGPLKPLMGATYPRVVLTGRKYESIHRLVMTAFVGPDSRHVNHKDGVRTNNCLSNLEYCTQSENMKHAFRIGLQSNRGENHSRARLTEEKVREIRRLVASGVTQAEVAKMMNICPSGISRANSGVRWGHVANQRGDVQAKNLSVAG